jgi:hypothetical protein
VSEVVISFLTQLLLCKTNKNASRPITALIYTKLSKEKTIVNDDMRQVRNHVRVKIPQERCAYLTNLACPSSDYTMASSVGVFSDGVAFLYREGFASERQRNRKCRITWNRPDGL